MNQASEGVTALLRAESPLDVSISPAEGGLPGSQGALRIGQNTVRLCSYTGFRTDVHHGPTVQVEAARESSSFSGKANPLLICGSASELVTVIENKKVDVDKRLEVGGEGDVQQSATTLTYTQICYFLPR